MYINVHSLQLIFDSASNRRTVFFPEPTLAISSGVDLFFEEPDLPELFDIDSTDPELLLLQSQIWEDFGLPKWLVS